jgi:perosamine synthetase
MKIDFYNTYISSNASGRVTEVLNSTHLSEGAITEKFEQELIRTFGFRYVVALNSGTSALHLALDILGIGEGDEVIIPAQTFIATGLAVLYCKATPVFADINYEDGNINAESIRLKITPRTKAIICVHWGGYPCDMDALKELVNNTEIKLIEDAAHALGAQYKREVIGNIADVTCFSFQAIKHLTTGDGGAVTMTDKSLYEKACRKKWFGIDRKNSEVSVLGERSYDLKEVGYKYHMNNYAAALGLENLAGFMDRLQKRRELADFYLSELRELKNIRLFENQKNRTSAYWLFGFHTPNREQLISKLKEKQIPASVVHQRIDKYTVFGGTNKSLNNTNRFDETQLHIPIHDAITKETAAYIVDAIKNAC